MLLFNNCYFGYGPSENKRLTKDFELFWFNDPSNQQLILREEGDSNYKVLVKETVVEAGYNDEFIILKHHPNVAQEIYDRLSDYDFDLKAYKVQKLSDTVWLSKNDIVFEYNGSYYHKEFFDKSFLPDHLKPNRAVTNYFIVDVRAYQTDSPNYEIYSCKTADEFLYEREQLGVPDDLEFTLKTPLLDSNE